MRQESTGNRILIPILSIAALTIFPACEQNGITDLAPAQGRAEGPRPAFALVVEPAAPVLEAGETIQLHALWRNSETGALHLADEPIQWASEAPMKARVSEAGLLEVYEAGEVVILAAAQFGDPNAPGNQAEVKVLVK
jgi:hypothetical protein